jgi:hypothetical protein
MIKPSDWTARDDDDAWRDEMRGMTGHDMTTEEIQAVLTDFLFGRITIWSKEDHEYLGRYCRELGEELDRRARGESPEPPARQGQGWASA